MDSTEHLLKLIRKIADDPMSRVGSIADLQRIVWGGGADHLPPSVQKILRDLVYDLDFFEPSEQSRAEDPAFFGPDRLEKEIRSALRRLAEVGL